MVEIGYKERFDITDLAGQSVVEAREQYQNKFDLPNKARAILNNKEIKRQDEKEILLCEDDKLTFTVKSPKAMLVMAALMLALAVTGGMFAYTYTTDTTTLTVKSAGADFVSVADNTTGKAVVVWDQPFGRYRGSVTGGILFDVTPAENYTADFVVNVYLSNLDEMSKNYSFLMLRFDFVTVANVSAHAQGAEKPLTLRNGSVDFYVNSFTDGTTYYVRLVGGTYMGLPWVGSGWSGGTYSPILYCEVVQAGLN